MDWANACQRINVCTYQKLQIKSVAIDCTLMEIPSVLVIQESHFRFGNHTTMVFDAENPLSREHVGV
jgi:hypothetical protein